MPRVTAVENLFFHLTNSYHSNKVSKLFTLTSIVDVMDSNPTQNMLTRSLEGRKSYARPFGCRITQLYLFFPQVDFIRISVISIYELVRILLNLLQAGVFQEGNGVEY